MCVCVRVCVCVGVCMSDIYINFLEAHITQRQIMWLLHQKMILLNIKLCSAFFDYKVELCK